MHLKGILVEELGYDERAGNVWFLRQAATIPADVQLFVCLYFSRLMRPPAWRFCLPIAIPYEEIALTRLASTHDLEVRSLGADTGGPRSA